MSKTKNESNTTMFNRFLKKYLVYVTALLAIIAFVYWFTYNPVKQFTASVPGMDSVPATDTSALEKVIIGEHFFSYAQEESTLKGKWLRFRGVNSDNIVTDKTKLISSFGTEGPKIVWSVDLGEGHSAPVIYNGKVYFMDYNEIKKRDELRCFLLESGTELWKRSYDVHVKRNHGMSRTTPALTEKYLVTMGPMGHVMCVNPANGDLLWSIDLVKEYNTVIPFWYTGQCPLIDNDIAIFAPGGSALLIGVDCETGKVVWETSNPDGLQMSHSSIIPMKLGNKNTYVYAAIGGIVGVSAEGNDVGKILWKDTEFVPNVVAPSPVVFNDGKVFMTAGYGAGSILFKVNPENYQIEVIQQFKPKEGLASEQQTPVVINDRIYGILPKDAGSLRNQMVCYSVNDMQTPIWTSGKEARFGLGPYIFADGKFFIVDDDGSLTIATISETGFNVLDKYRVIEGHDAWGPIAIADGYLIMRDSKKMVCLNMRK
ncbi:MAG: PQQ-binding-like beta-propeller repeat protein [Salinivirgaceae bacterium]|nr:PQQ-binding-like beta-propeller repeat protein [Salinivirgaceae bacterium]